MEDFTCRICFDDEKKSKLLMPCKCNQPIHKRCLKKWMKIKKNPEYCEICKEKYNVDFIVISRYNESKNTLEEWDRIYENNLNIYIINKKFILFLLLVILICIVLIFVELKIQIDKNNLQGNISIPGSSIPESPSP